MKQARLTLFTSPTCTRCPQAKSMVDEALQEARNAGVAVELNVIDATTDEGMMKAVEFNAGLSVPKLVINESSDIDSHIGFDRMSKQSILQAITKLEE